jgi:hypothetical protein
MNKISGFTIARNVIKNDYPILESIHSILPICDEFVVNVGDSHDETLRVIQSIKSHKIRIIQNLWDLSRGPEVLSQQTNLALSACKGTWAFYLQADEIVHESDLGRLKRVMDRYADDDSVDSLRFEWLHFYGSYYRYRDDNGWFQKQDRVVRNNGTIESFEDAYTFRRKDGRDMSRKRTGCLLYHYGWVHDAPIMTKRLINHEEIGFSVPLTDENRDGDFDYGDLNKFPIYFGSHPQVMRERISRHALSAADWRSICWRHAGNPFKIFKFRYKRHRGLVRRTYNQGKINEER